MSILPDDGDVLPDGDDIIDDDTYEPTLSDDSDGTSTADKQSVLSPSVLKPILPSNGLDSVSLPAAGFSTAEPAKAARTVIAPLSNVSVKDSGENQAVYNNFSFFSLSPSSFLRGKKTTSNRQQHF